MKIPGALAGTVRVPIPKVNIWMGLAGVPLAYAGSIMGEPITLAIGIGTMSVMPIGIGVQWLSMRRVDKKVGHWPVSVQVMPGEAGERVAFVTSHDGTVTSLVLPDDYDPSDDDGEWFIRQVAPDLAEAMFDEEDKEVP